MKCPNCGYQKNETIYCDRCGYLIGINIKKEKLFIISLLLFIFIPLIFITSIILLILSFL